MEKIDKAIEILQAFKEGKTIEWLNSGVWVSFSGDYENLIGFFGNSLNKIRVKPQPTYRPYTNAEEFLKESKEHGPYFKDDTDCLFLPIYITNKYIETKEWEISYEDMIKDCAILWQDGTPCGILKQ